MTFQGSGPGEGVERSPDPRKSRPPLSPPPSGGGWYERFKAQFLEMLGRHDEPEKVAASFAIGVAIAFTPLLGFHWIMAFFAAILLKLNKLDVFLGTLVVNPLTLGPVSAVALPLGRLIVRARQEAVTLMPWGDLLRPAAWAQAAPAMRTMGIQWAIGMFALSILFGALTYLTLVRVLRNRRARAAVIPPDFAD
ncbi:MAG: DUF2062 domain-containing protein [Holophagales bacterium]|nr:DUF2062 domain-containing protein [Holophagales bacterium]MBK9964241.1 DUF2062 domain-containing protein [Holophagales bacterium]